MPAKIWDQTKVIAAIQSLYTNNNPSPWFVQQNHKDLYLAAKANFGNWKSAVEAAGIDYESTKVKERPKPKWGKEKIIGVILKRYEDRLPLNSNFIQTKLPRLYAAAHKYFGGWAQAIAEAGLDYSKIRVKKPYRVWSKTIVIAEIQARVLAGLSLSYCWDPYGDAYDLYTAAKRHCGSWEKALTLAQVEKIDPRITWTKSRVIVEILVRYIKGLPLNSAAVMVEYQALKSAGEKHFGSWQKAIEAAGFNYDEVRLMQVRDKENIIADIKLLHDAGAFLSHSNMRKLECALVSSAVYHFGNWATAVYAAGIDYAEHCQIWSSKAWVRSLSVEQKQEIFDNIQDLSQRRTENAATKKRRISNTTD
ncbi:MAG TPA: hypothetical protein VEA59_04975 [Patescibacteria group bacterium]|nr:hypothetical protein [Patescibacteria group bacterium]